MATSDLFLGVDVGGTVAKAALYRPDGSRVAYGSGAVAPLISRPGFSEIDIDGLWTTVAGTIRGVVEAAAIVPSRIRAVGITGFGNGLLLLDRKGRPVGRAIASTDVRATAVVEGWSRRGLDALARSRTWHVPWPGQPAALIAWLAQNAPGDVESAASLLQCKDYIRYRLTGELAVELTDLSSAGLINGERRTPDAELMAALGVPVVIELLPRTVLAPLDLAGQVSEAGSAATGLAPGTPVVAGASDVLAVLLGAGATARDTVSIVSGTWNINQRLSSAPVPDAPVFGSTRTHDPERVLVFDNSTSGASNLDWFVDRFMAAEVAEAADHGTSVYDACNRLVEQTDPRVVPVLFLPFVHGSRELPGAGATFAGFTRWHGKAHALRGVYEGIAFEHRIHLGRVLAATGPARAARLAGGVIASPVWTQIFADIIGLEMELPAEPQLGTLGAAITAAVGVGTYEGVEQAIDAMTRLSRTVAPRDELRGTYEHRFAEYLALRASIEQLSDARAGGPPHGVQNE